MKNILKSRKGATLSELVIVLAVLVIASGMVVTFSSMMHGAQGVSNERHEALQDVVTAETLIEGFIENNTREGYYVKWIDSADGNNIMSNLCFYNTMNGSAPSDEGSKYIQLYSNGAFVMTGKEVIFFEHIKSIAFEVVAAKEAAGTVTPDPNLHVFYSNNTVDILYYCTITYEVADTEYTYTFCVNPYVGEEVN